MRKPTLYLLLALLLFTGKAMHGYSAVVIVNLVVANKVEKETQHIPYSIKAINESDLSFTHSVTGNTQHAGIKKLPGYPTIQQLQVLDRCLAKITPVQNAANEFEPPHLALIFPFHYFW